MWQIFQKCALCKLNFSDIPGNGGQISVCAKNEVNCGFRPGYKIQNQTGCHVASDPGQDLNQAYSCLCDDNNIVFVPSTLSCASTCKTESGLKDMVTVFSGLHTYAVGNAYEKQKFHICLANGGNQIYPGHQLDGFSDMCSVYHSDAQINTWVEKQCLCIGTMYMYTIYVTRAHNFLL